MSRSIRIAVVAVALAIVAPRAVHAQAGASTAGISLDSLLNTRISGAAKYAQTADEAAASVTILTSDDIERNGYANLSELFESVRGFYVSSDRNYSYLGSRGFSRPSDYNNRILLLVDGHTINEFLWGSAPIGDDLTLDLAAIERIEFIRGPGSVLYGTNAMFAVINIVTKPGTTVDGLSVSARAASFGQRQASLTGGRALGSKASIAFSGSFVRSEGQSLYLPEFDVPGNNGGIADHVDSDRAAGALAALTYGDMVVRAGLLTKYKRVPTGSFGNRFNDPRTDRRDAQVWIDASSTRSFGPSFRLTTRAYGDIYDYKGNSAYHADSVFTDVGNNTNVGAEVLGIWEATSRNRLTVGAEYRHILRARYAEQFPDGTTTFDDAPSSIRSVFVQDEFQLTPRLKAVGGWRLEDNALHGTNTAPRVALILTPNARTTVKALYGEAFRAPSAAEANIETNFYHENPDLRAERVRTMELAATHRLGRGVLLGGSLYSYRLVDLIDQEEFDADGDLVYTNISKSRGSGAEVEFDLRPADALMLRSTYVYQFEASDTDGERLSNAPTQVATTAATLRGRAVYSTLSLRYETGRRNSDGSSTRAFVRTDAHVGSNASILGGADIGLRVSNLFDTRYSTPVGIEHVAPAMEQLGRRVSLSVTWRF